MWNVDKFGAFTEGEGCFYYDMRPDSFICVFEIQQRNDDRIALVELSEWLGFGDVMSKPSNRATMLRVRKRADAMQLVEMFDSYDWVTKKFYDYMIWRMIPELWRRTGASSVELYDVALRIREHLKGVKRYDVDREDYYREACKDLMNIKCLQLSLF